MDQTERNVGIIRKRLEKEKNDLRSDLEFWLETIPPTLHVPLTAALLEAAIDRNLKAAGVEEARGFLFDVFERQAEKYRRSLS